MGWGGGGGIINRMYCQASSCASQSSMMDFVSQAIQGLVSPLCFGEIWLKFKAFFVHHIGFIVVSLKMNDQNVKKIVAGKSDNFPIYLRVRHISEQWRREEWRICGPTSGRLVEPR